jgi:hypothetical protein
MRMTHHLALDVAWQSMSMPDRPATGIACDFSPFARR